MLRRVVPVVVSLCLTGCAHGVVREPVKPVVAHEGLRSVPVALLDVVVVPAPTPVDAAQRVVSFPDEIFVKTEREGVEWTVVPSPMIVPATEILVLSLQHMGLNVRRYPSLAAAHQGGARLAIVFVLRRGIVTVGPNPLRFVGAVLPRTAEASAAGVASVLDVTSGRTLWSGPVNAIVRYERAIYLPEGGPVPGMFSIEANAMTIHGEATGHSARALLTRAYFSLAGELAAVLNRLHQGSK